MREISIEELATFCKKKGFVYPSGEIYGSLAGFWDFGPLGVELKNNIKKEWWKFHVHNKEEIVGIDGAIITNPKVWEASGHVENFVDFIVVNKKTGEKFKIDSYEVGRYKKNKDFIVEGAFNPMFTTNVGPSVSKKTIAYLRPETAQLIFTNFKNVAENSRLKLPFGIAQIGKAFRNEISPREFLFRSREFEQMEIEYFIAPKMECPFIEEIKGGAEIEILTEESQRKKQNPKKMTMHDAWKKKIVKSDWHAYFLALEFSWFLSLGANPEKFRIRQHTSEERSHYASDTWDLEYSFPMGWRELEGFANRSDFDLKQHEKFSGKNMQILDEKYGRITPQVVCEPSLGVERAFLVFLLDAIEEIKEKDTVLHLSPKLAPYKAGIFPLISKGEILDVSKEVYHDLLEEFNVLFDKSGSIGRRYARNDEIGTPFCITIDEQTLKDKTVTIRERDTTRQVRTEISKLKDTLRNLINGEITLSEAGKLV